MPTIEIFCGGQSSASAFSEMPFAVWSSPSKVSHRAKFQKDFDALDGVLYHLGNAKFVDTEGVFFGSDLVTFEHPALLRFEPSMVAGIRKVFSVLLDESPKKRLLFTTDCQSGPDHTLRADPMPVDRFWELHDESSLVWHCAYLVHGPQTSS